MPSNLKAHAAVIAANTIFGLGVPVTKYLLDHWLTPNTYMLARCVGAAAVFWLIAWLTPRERIRSRDLALIIGAGLLGFVVSQTLTAWALRFTSPVYFSLIATLTPVAVLLLSAAFLGERVSAGRVCGVSLAIGGAALMVLLKWQDAAGSDDLLGLFLALLSLLTWAVYLIITRKVSQRYGGVSQMKWVFLASTLVVLPYAWGEVASSPLVAVPLSASANAAGAALAADWGWGMAAILFIVGFATVAGFFLLPYAMRQLRATTVSVYTNLQPVVASLVAIAVAQDTFSWDKPAAAALVLAGAWLVTRE